MKTKYEKNFRGLGTDPRSAQTRKLHTIDFARRRENRRLPLEKMLQVIERDAPEFWELIQVVGKWLWIQFDGKQPRRVTATLSELGFHYCRRREAWQHPCGNLYTLPAHNSDPRQTYRSYFLAA